MIKIFLCNLQKFTICPKVWSTHVTSMVPYFHPSCEHCDTYFEQIFRCIVYIVYYECKACEKYTMNSVWIKIGTFGPDVHFPYWLKFSRVSIYHSSYVILQGFRNHFMISVYKLSYVITFKSQCHWKVF